MNVNDFIDIARNYNSGGHNFYLMLGPIFLENNFYEVLDLTKQRVVIRKIAKMYKVRYDKLNFYFKTYDNIKFKIGNN